MHNNTQIERKRNQKKLKLKFWFSHAKKIVNKAAARKKGNKKRLIWIEHKENEAVLSVASIDVMPIK